MSLDAHHTSQMQSANHERQLLPTILDIFTPLEWQRRTCSAGLSAGPAAWEGAAPRCAAAGPGARSPGTHLTEDAGAHH